MQTGVGDTADGAGPAAPGLTQAQAQEYDAILAELGRGGKPHPIIACRMMYRMRIEGYERLGFPTFRAYLKARGIAPARAYQLASVFAKLSVELGLSDMAWMNIPLSRLLGSVRIISRLNVKDVLADARIMSRRQFRGHLKRLRGAGGPELGGLYELVPCQAPATLDRKRRQEVAGRILTAQGGRWFIEVRT